MSILSPPICLIRPLGFISESKRTALLRENFKSDIASFLIIFQLFLISISLSIVNWIGIGAGVFPFIDRHLWSQSHADFLGSALSN